MSTFTKFKFIIEKEWNRGLVFDQIEQNGHTYSQYKEVAYG